MRKTPNLLLLIFLYFLLGACTSDTESSTIRSNTSINSSIVNVNTVPCSSAWYQHIENILITSDKTGHGPDLGSAEWRSVIEFKLGLRDSVEPPEIMSQVWCDYINVKISELKAKNKNK